MDHAEDANQYKIQGTVGGSGALNATIDQPFMQRHIEDRREQNEYLRQLCNRLENKMQQLMGAQLSTPEKEPSAPEAHPQYVADALSYEHNKTMKSMNRIEHCIAALSDFI